MARVSPSPDVDCRLNQLLEVASQLEIDIQRTILSDDEIEIQSGFCKLRNVPTIILDRRLAPERQIDIILEGLKQCDTESHFLPAWIRENLERPFEDDTRPKDHDT